MRHSNFSWGTLQKPVMVLAPMANVTDVAFRRVIAKYGKPDVLWTEFVSADGLTLAPESGRKKLLKDLEYDESERPIIAQFFTSRPEMMEKAAMLAVELGFDGIDINMGCPDRTIEKQGAGAALMKTPKIARAVIRAAQRGVAKAGSTIPVSVKTRIGWNKVELETWLPEILEENPALVTIHARTRKEMSLVPARWEFVKRAVEIRNERKSSALIFGNGDVKNLAEADARVKETGCDGVMIGRGIFGNPFLFNRTKQIGDLPVSERLAVMVEHTKKFEERLGGIKNFAIMKKHYKAYVTGFDGAKELRTRLMEEATDAAVVEKIVNEWLANTKQV